MKPDNGALCALPWLHLNLSPDGYATLCCQSSLHLFDDNGAPLNAQTHSLQDIWSSGSYREIRRRMLAGERIPHCEACYRNEKLGWGSARQHANQLWLRQPGEQDNCRLDLETLCEDTGDKPRYFDLRIGNVCNLKCVNCRSHYSSQIERDPVHSKWSDTPFARLSHRFSGTGEWWEAPQLLEEIKAISGDAQEIQLAGGEPTLNRLLIEWLDHLCQTGKAKDIDLGIVTNLTNVQDRVYRLISQFQHVDIKISLDGYGKVYEYVRYPGKWRSIEKNIERVMTLENKPNITIFPVLNVYNTLYMTELFEWAESRGLPVMATIVRASDHVDCRLLPPAARAEAQRRFAAFFQRHQAAAGGVLPPRLQNLAMQIETAFAEIEETDFTPSQRRTKVATFMHFTNDMDLSRGLSFRETCPETYAFFLANGEEWNDMPGFALNHHPSAVEDGWRSWSDAWTAARGLPNCAGFSDLILAHGIDSLDRWAADIRSAADAGLVDTAAQSLSDLFEAFARMAFAWYDETEIAKPAVDGYLKPRYLLFRLIADRLLDAGMCTEDLQALVRAYLVLTPHSRAAKLTLGEILADTGAWQHGVELVQSVVQENSNLFLPQQILVQIYRLRYDADETPVVDGVYIGDLSNRFCHVPFDELMTDSEGKAWTCCPSFLPVPVGDIYQTGWEDIWRSKVAEELRRSILDGDFRHCSRTQCPAMLSGSLPHKADVADPMHRAAIEAATPPAGPRKFYFCHDATCNLECRQCRPGMYRAEGAASERLVRLMDTLVRPILAYAEENACSIVISGNGDPFASPHYLEILKEFSEEKHGKVALHLITNGLLFRYYWEKLSNIHGLVKRGYVGFSIDAASPEIYQEVRGGRWDKLMESLELLGTLRRAGQVTSAGINFAVQDCNFQDMPAAAELARRLGVDCIGFNIMRNQGTYTAEEYRLRNVFDPAHPRHVEFLEVLRHPALRREGISFGALEPYFRQAITGAAPDTGMAQDGDIRDFSSQPSDLSSAH